MYESLLDRVYELEGLLHLALEREEVPERLRQLIADKALRIAEPFTASTHSGGREDAVISKVRRDEPEDKPEDIPAEEPEMPGVVSVRVIPDVTEYAPKDKPEDIADDPEDTPEDKPEDDPEDIADDTPEDMPESEAEDLPVEETDEDGEEETEDMGTVPAERPPLRRRFSLNDRFRFSRELFGGNPGRFDETLRKLDTMDTADDAEDYLIEVLGWDPDDDDIATEFIEIIRAGF